MTDHTPEPCGCKVQWAYSDTHPPVIHYCPTHAAAFENKELVEAWSHGEPVYSEARVESLKAQNADLLAALKMVADGYGHAWPINVVNIVVAAIAKARSEPGA